MKIIVFNGSPKAENGNTHSMVEIFLAGASDAGAEVENIFLAHKNINHCTSCGSCAVNTPGKCVINDDMAELLEKFQSCDIAVFATPLYVDNVSGMMKVFMDRMIPLLEPVIIKDQNGESVHPMRGKVPKIGVISNCGYPEQSHFQVLRLLFKRVARNMNSEVVFEIYRGAGAVLSSSSILIKMMVSKYKKLLKRAGWEIADTGKLSNETIGELEKPLFPPEVYIKEANKYFEKLKAKKK